MVIKGPCSECEAWLLEAITELLRAGHLTTSQKSTSWPWRALSDVKPHAVLQEDCCWFCTHAITTWLRERDSCLREEQREERGLILKLPEVDTITLPGRPYVARTTVPFAVLLSSSSTDIRKINATLDTESLDKLYNDANLRSVLYYGFHSQGGLTSSGLQRYPDPYEEEVHQAGSRSFEGFLNPVRRELIRDLLFECDKCHNCLSLVRNDTIHSHFLPLRLLEISGRSKLSVRLVETSALLSAGNVVYATLSHVWGTKQFLKLTTDHITAFRQAIPMDLLARTFQETIQLCADLEIPYVWIDSLCIVQDSIAGQDWLRQAPVMHLVYQNATLNIAACSSTSSDEGLIKPFNPKFCQDLVIDVPYTNEEAYRFNFESLTQTYWAKLPLFQRSWVVQELYLAPRVLYFSDIAVYWQCQRARWSETGSIFTQIFDNSIWTARGSKELDEYWKNLIQDYSRTKLTVKSDRIYAMAGLAASFASRYRDFGQPTRYILGCWEHQMAEYLLWHRIGIADDTIGTFSTPSSPLASWSWLVHPGTVIFRAQYATFEALTKILFKTILLNVEPANADSPYSAIRSCNFEVRAQLCRLDVEPIPDTKVTTPHNDEFAWSMLEYSESLRLSDGRNFYHNWKFAADENDVTRTAPSLLRASIQPDRVLTLHQFRALTRTCRCMFVGADIDHSPVQKSCFADLYALVLVPAEGPRRSRSHCYRRVGLLRLRLTCLPQDKDMIQKLVRSLDPESPSAETFNLV